MSTNYDLSDKEISDFRIGNFIYTCANNNIIKYASLLNDQTIANTVINKEINLVTALHMSAFLGYKPIVELLLKIGANVNTLRGDGSSALLLASGQGYVSIVDILIKHGAYVNKARTEDGISPLFMAAQNGHGNNL